MPTTVATASWCPINAAHRCGLLQSPSSREASAAPSSPSSDLGKVELTEGTSAGKTLTCERLSSSLSPAGDTSPERLVRARHPQSRFQAEAEAEPGSLLSPGCLPTSAWLQSEWKHIPKSPSREQALGEDLWSHAYVLQSEKLRLPETPGHTSRGLSPGSQALISSLGVRARYPIAAFNLLGSLGAGAAVSSKAMLPEGSDPIEQGGCLCWVLIPHSPPPKVLRAVSGPPRGPFPHYSHCLPEIFCSAPVSGLPEQLSTCPPSPPHLLTSFSIL